MNKLPSFAPFVLRLGLAGVLIWFGSSQLLDQTAWTSFIPDWMVATGLSAQTILILNGLFEVVMGSFLALGFFVRPVASVLFVHMAGIIFTVGLSPIGVRDVGIAAGLLSVALYGNDIFSWKTSTATTTSKASTTN